jgi:alkylmercury lyase
MNEGVSNALIGEIGTLGAAAALTRTAFNAILGGRAMSRAELMAATGATTADIERLVGRALVLDADDRVVAAHGLSLVPARQHRLRLRGRQFWTWCAIDAVGIPAGLDEDAVVQTTCVQCGTEVSLELHGQQIVGATHPNARVWEAQRREGRGPAGPPHCALMNLFCSGAHLGAWREAHPSEQGRERDLIQIVELGQAEWGYLHDPGASSCGCGDSCGDGSKQKDGA